MKRHLLTALALIALVLLIYFNWPEIAKAFGLLKSVRWQYLLLVPLTLTISFLARAKYYQSFAHALGYTISYKKILRLTYGVNFVNQISPSVGITGATYLSYNLRNKVPAGKITLIEYSRYIITHLSFAPLLILGFGFVYFGGSIDKILVRIVLLVVAAAVVAGVLFIFALRRRRQIDKVVYWMHRVINSLAGLFRRNKKPLIKESQIASLLGDFHEGVDFITKNWLKLEGAFAAGIVINLMEVSALYVSFLALDYAVNPGAIIIGYSAATIAGAVSIIPGDVGVFELAMVTAFSSIGVPVSVALSATLLYRVLNKTLSLPVGFYFYSRSINNLPKKSIPPIVKKVIK